jgi:hypothetical protein
MKLLISCKRFRVLSKGSNFKLILIALRQFLYVLLKAWIWLFINVFSFGFLFLSWCLCWFCSSLWVSCWIASKMPDKFSNWRWYDKLDGYCRLYRQWQAQKGADFSLVSRRNIRLWLSSDERNVLLCIPPFGASAYVLLTIMVTRIRQQMDLQWEAWAGVSWKGLAQFLGEAGAVMPLTYPT